MLVILRYREEEGFVLLHDAMFGGCVPAASEGKSTLRSVVSSSKGLALNKS